jgi:diaminopropionate ammonia-lyase
MAGLACGPDEAAVAFMRLLADRGVVAGESAVAGLAGLLLAAGDSAARETLGLDG